ncbi:MAG TPA: carboxyl transferase domain-containing protein, partial [Bacillota bacterium]|nr:carboxyl transferase domain-containing protein [Bacillota bacterium]
IGADVTFALDTAKIGAMSAQSAVAFLWDDKFAGAKDPDVRRKELEAEWDETYGNATEAAMKGEIDDVIPSDELLARIAASLEMLSMKDASMPTKRRSNLPL